MSEQQPDTAPQIQSGEEERKVFAVRLDPGLREQIEGLRNITGHSVNEVGVEALTDWVTKVLSDEAVQQKAMTELDAEEQRLQARRAAIAGILGQQATAAGAPSGNATTRQTGSQSGRRGKPRTEP